MGALLPVHQGLSNKNTILQYLDQASAALHLRNPFFMSTMFKGSISISTVYKLSRREISQQSRNSNHGPMGQKRKHYHCAVQPPKQNHWLCMCSHSGTCLKCKVDTGCIPDKVGGQNYFEDVKKEITAVNCGSVSLSMPLVLLLTQKYPSKGQ